MNYYNEHDPKISAWLRGLIAAGLIPDGTVDQRSICDVHAGDLAGFQQCHFFAGIAGWPLALQLAGWPAGWRVWTGSCPCQPFSVAGKKKGKKDERHLWPVWFRLIAACRPECIFGEQVASPDARDWLDGVQTDMEGIGYTFGAVIMGAHSAGADHGRQRIYWMAIAPGERFPTGLSGMHGDQREAEPSGAEAGAVADSYPLHCLDGNWRRVPTDPALYPIVEPSVFTVDDGVSGRVGRRRTIRPALLRGAGNAIVTETAAEFIKAGIEWIMTHRANSQI